MPKHQQPYHQQAYLWISIALLMPVILWPAFLLFGFTPAFGVRIEQNWVIAASCLLIASIVADSMLAYRHRLIDAVVTAIWMMASSAIVSIAIRDERMVWLLAFLFFLRTLPILYKLWKNQSHLWWHWMAWIRDGSATLAIFLWLHYWPQ